MKTVFNNIIVLLLLTSIFSCNNNDNPAPAPTLIDITPLSGPKNTVVTIKGSNFGTDLSKVTVFFNNKEALIQSISDREIKALMPVGAQTGVVKLIVNGTELVGPEFIYIITEITVSTLAGSVQGLVDGIGIDAMFYAPAAIAMGVSGNMYIADAFNHKIRKITPEGVVSTFAGSTQGFADGTRTNAKFNLPVGITIDAAENLYVSDLENHKIRKITPEGVVSTLAGSTQGFTDGIGNIAKFDTPFGLVIDDLLNVYVADVENHKIRKITPQGAVSTLAGSTQGFADGTGSDVKFDEPSGITLDVSGNLYVTDTKNHKIRKITPEGIVSTLAGSTEGFADGIGGEARFNEPNGITLDASNNIYVTDTKNHKIRKITPDGVVSTLAGNDEGFSDGNGAIAKFNNPIGIKIDDFGNIYVADVFNHKIRKVAQE